MIQQSFIPRVVEQHEDKASSIWMMRRSLDSAPHCRLTDLVRHDGRIEAHLEGLRLAGDAAWQICRGALEIGGAEEMFTATILALESAAEDRQRLIFE